MAERDKKVKEEYEKAKPFSRAGRMRAAGVAMGTIKKQAADRKAEARAAAEAREAKKGRPGAGAGVAKRGETDAGRTRRGGASGPTRRGGASGATRRAGTRGAPRTDRQRATTR